MDVDSLNRKFEEIYGQKPEHAYFAPGRVNLIGEHIDYNGGRVFPCALSFGTYLLIAKREDHQTEFVSLNQEYRAVLGVDAYANKPEEWVRYPLGVMKEFADKGYDVWGYDLLYYGDIPGGAGLSSSASIEVVTAIMLNDRLKAGLDRVVLVKMSQRAENIFVGMNCGIMDQFASGMGKQDYAIALDCATLDYEWVPLHMEGYKLVIANTNKKHGLVDSKYNERRQESEEALNCLKQKLPIHHLCELNREEFEKYADLIKNEKVRRRARHAVTENERVNEAIRALKEGNLPYFGRLMNASHRSLKEDYEVTGKELDTMAEEGQKLEGVLGARMTGGGFGGCTVNLVSTEAVASFVERLSVIYKNKIGLEPEFYIVDIGEGAYQLY